MQIKRGDQESQKEEQRSSRGRERESRVGGSEVGGGGVKPLYLCWESTK